MAALRRYTGVYRLGGDHRLGIGRFIADNGDSTLLFSDYETGLVRPLFRISPTEFAMGPSFAVQSPVELVVQFEMDGQGAVQGRSMRPAGGAATFAAKHASRDEKVVFRQGDITLSGTMMEVARTGKGYQEFLARRQEMVAGGRSSLLSYESGNFTLLRAGRLRAQPIDRKTIFADVWWTVPQFVRRHAILVWRSRAIGKSRSRQIQQGAVRKRKDTV